MYSFNDFATTNFFGDVLITDLDGNFISKFKVEDGLITTKYVANQNNTQANTTSRNINCECQWECHICELDAVFIEPRPGVELGNLYTSVVPEEYQDQTYEITPGPSGGGGGGNGPNNAPCGNGQILDGDGNCVNPEDNPCENLNTLNTDADYDNKVEFLETKTGDTEENGFARLDNGTFVLLNRNNDGHSLKFEISPNMVGFMHTHLDKFNTGNYDENNNPEFKKAIQMFSPNDVLRFLELVQNANTNPNINIADVFGVMITSKGNYTLKFNGSVNNINTNFSPDDLKDSFKEYIDDFGRERGLLKFIQEKTNNNGVALYKVKKRNNGTYKTVEKKLNDNGRVDSETCN